MKPSHGLLVAAAAAAITVSTAWSQSSRPGDLKVGDAAPDFTIKDVQGKQSVTLSELKGKPVVLLFGSCT
jgi:cytochrome oxidase Cu insertion factor (SCO1/SenC/PrrC family)